MSDSTDLYRILIYVDPDLTPEMEAITSILYPTFEAASAAREELLKTPTFQRINGVDIDTAGCDYALLCWIIFPSPTIENRPDSIKRLGELAIIRVDACAKYITYEGCRDVCPKSLECAKQEKEWLAQEF